ncbi:MAG: DUF6512 family protein [Minisyncoccia bacterium]
MKTKILRLELIGALFIIFFGSLLHFTFDWFKNFWLAGIFSAVNESTWEHLKLAVIPATIWFLIEKKWIKFDIPNFTFAKIKGIFLMQVLIVVIFYSYTALLGKNYLVLDILTFVVAVVLGQLLSYWLMFYPPVRITQTYSVIAIIFLILLLLSFAVFTFYPPHCFLFRDPISGSYGINLLK